MNLIITSTCNKKCSFCFAEGKGEQKELSLEDIISIIKKSSRNEDIKLLGGEPTLHSDFAEILNYCKNIKNNVLLISNFFIKKDEVKNAIIEFQNSKELRFLINVAELTQNQYELVSDNIKNLIKNKEVSLGYTLDRNRDFDSYKVWLEKFMIDVRDKVKNIRVSVPFPNFKQGEEKKFYLYNEYYFTDLIEKFIRWADQYDLPVSIDCGLFPCMFRDEEQKQFFFRKIGDLKLGCTGGAFDIFNQKIASLCYPGKDICVDISDHDSLDTAFNELLIKKQYYYAAKNNLPKECKDCKFLNKECAGPCIGFCAGG